jgi:parallel beta-helix repeat protein
VEEYQLKRKCLVVGIILLFVGTGIIPTIAQKTEKPSLLTSRGNWLYVGGSGPGNYSKIQDAINDSHDGDTVFVYDDSSPYYENIEVNKRINLFGESRYSTVIDGRENGDVIQIYRDNVSICELNIQNSSLYPQTPGGYGILLDFGNHCTIKNNIITHTFSGIRIPKNSHSNLVSDNKIIENQDCGTGISVGYFWENSEGNNRIINNTISDSFTGINICSSSGNEIRNNSMKNMNEGIILICSEQSIIFGNHIEKIINYGIRLSLSNNSRVAKNSVENTTDNGIILLNSSYCIVSENEIRKNAYGIFLFDNSELNSVFGNHIIDNNYGIYTFLNSSKNNIYHNNFINNTLNAFDNTTNSWNNSYPSGGNYWSDYTGVDNYHGPNQNISGSDGIGDTPYDFPCEHAIDWYPLVLPYGMTELTITIQPVFFHLSVVIKNAGNTTAFNVQWNRTIDGFVLFGKDASGLLLNLLPGEEIRVTSNKLFMGFGRIEITASAWAENAPMATEKISGILFLFFFFSIF